MKFNIALVAVVLALSSGAANANIVNITGPYTPPSEDLGNVVVGQSGQINIGNNYYSTIDTIPTTPPLYNVQGVVIGSIPSMSKITFTYTYSGASQVFLDGSGYYTPYVKGGNTYAGSADANTGYIPGGSPSHNYVGTTNGVPSLPLVWSTANITSPVSGAGTGTVTIQNNSGSFVNFTTTFMAFLTNLGAPGGTLHYNVSAIPLPPAAMLFGTALVGMFGFGYARKRKASVAA